MKNNPLKQLASARAQRVLWAGASTKNPELENEGVEKFNKPFDKLMETLTRRSSGQSTIAL